MKPNKPANVPDTGPVRKRMKNRKRRKSNPTKKGGIFGNACGKRNKV